MPDYDPKSIPILDDIIENEIDDENVDTTEADNKKIFSEEISTDIVDAEGMLDDNTPDLFHDDIADIKVETVEPEIAAIDTSIIDDIEDEAESGETEATESALIDYQLEDDNTEIDDSEVIDHQPEAPPASRIQTFDSDMPVDPVMPIDIDAIVDDVVKKMMPDLEQQLRFLIQQALEEKLGNSNS